MAVISCQEYTCDRCGEKERIEAVAAEIRPRPPTWARWSYSAPGATAPIPTKTLDICPTCIEEIQFLITAGPLVHVGHAKQSGSGRSWTELGLKNVKDPERWFNIYAFASGVKGDRVLQKAAEDA